MSVLCCEVSHPVCCAVLSKGLLLAGMPQRGEDVLHCQCVHRVGGNHAVVVLHMRSDKGVMIM